jgi:hypothetical protein
MMLNGTVDAIKTTMYRLQQDEWIDDRTRAIFVEFSVYNAQINLFAVVQLLLEIPPIGIIK